MPMHNIQTDAVTRGLQWVLRSLSLRLLGINLVTADVAERAGVLPPCEIWNKPLVIPAAVVLYFTCYQDTSFHH